jgi:serine phosphatase RsbU (regulator of sigma subunit)
MPASVAKVVAPIYLVPVDGPPIEPLAIEFRPGGVTLGRHEQCDVCLPADAEKVSRMHVRFVGDSDRWYAVDLSSKWGTYLNGVRLTPQAELPLREGDHLRITPWTFLVSSRPRAGGVLSEDDSHRAVVRTIGDTGAPMAEAMLSLLLESATAIHSATDEKQLAQLVIDAAMRGTRLSHAAVLRPVGTDGRVEVVASRSPQNFANSPMTFSRSLLRVASTGQVAEINSVGGTQDISQSIALMNITAAICVPLMLGPAPAAYLYLDSRGSLTGGLPPTSSAYCVALGRMASLALANLKRLEMERRDAVMQQELAAAAAAQKWIMPQNSRALGPFVCAGQSRPGQFVGGDFFDIVELEGGRVAVALGDVSGKGISASVLMTATQGFLHAALTESSDPSRAVHRANRFVHPRTPDSKFVTAWVGVLDPASRTLRYVDAGHSYALLCRADGQIEQLNRNGGFPIGIEPDAQYTAESVELRPGDLLVVVSDGIIEQYGFVPDLTGSILKQQFGVAGVQKTLAHGAGDNYLNELFNAVVHHAGTNQLSDDATAVVLRVT